MIFIRSIPRLFFVLPVAILFASRASAEDSALIRVLLAPPAEQPAQIRSLLNEEDARIRPTLEAWRSGEIYIHTLPDGQRIPFTLSATANPDGTRNALSIETGQPLTAPADPAAPDAPPAPLAFQAKAVTSIETNAAIRRAIRDVSQVVDLADPSSAIRRAAAERLGMTQRPDYLPLLEARLTREKNRAVRRALGDGVALINLKNGNDTEKIAAIQQLQASHHLGVVTQLKEIVARGDVRPADPTLSPALVRAARTAITSIEHHYMWVNFWGTAFRGLSLSSVLLVTALGLAITYGLMGVINMAHGEIMVVGAYATYVTQNLFAGWFGAGGAGYNYYFLAALPVSFLAAALVGLVLERSVIQWLYRRPLESLLATWGVSLALQQGFRTVFGPANVQINSPAWLRGNIEIADLTLTWNRIFVIAFAVVVVAGAWLLLNRTRFGLYIRAVTQNRAMASCMGVRTERVNMLTFAFGSGLAGLAGACLAQIGNVGPGLGQSHIVDCFMVVVSGGVGSLAGTVYAALGIGSIDQILQPFLGAVMGKILVLVAIILFLQWKPGGLFPTRNRSLD
ncbi:urea ABC transporter, permease protein UrtB [Opitutaceae bacterium TAV1]|nr:urea ABC transporter, permease protein UrtB [Opitutaceae bacterium TAV1]